MATRRYSVVLIAAVVMALGATFGVWRVLNAMKAQSRIATRSVIVAARDIPEGGAIDRAAVSVNEWPAATIPAGAYASPDSVVGRVTRVAVFAGEAIVPGRLAPSGTGPGIEVKITPGKRAMALRIDDVAGVSGLIQPNSRVDVMITVSDGERQVSKLFMENMRVLSVGTQVQRGEDGQAISAATVALEVTPDEAERLSVAQTRGRIQLVLRGYGDPDSARTRGAGANDVLAGLGHSTTPAPKPAPKPAPRQAAPRPVVPTPAPVVVAPARPVDDSSTVRVYRGTAVSAVKVEKDSTKRP